MLYLFYLCPAHSWARVISGTCFCLRAPSVGLESSFMLHHSLCLVRQGSTAIPSFFHTSMQIAISTVHVLQHGADRQTLTSGSMGTCTICKLRLYLCLSTYSFMVGSWLINNGQTNLEQVCPRACNNTNTCSMPRPSIQQASPPGKHA